MRNQRSKFTVRMCSFLCVIGLAFVPADADIVVDVDPMTPGPQAAYAVASGASVTVSVWFDPFTSGPLAFNAVGLDLGWTPTGSATATPTTPPLAGSLAGRQ